MRKIIYLIHVSLDGYTAGPNGEMDWIVYNDEVADVSHALHDSTDTAIYGRVTYEMMASYWPTVLDQPNPDPSDVKHARWLATAQKIAVSTTLKSVSWENTRILSSDLEGEFKTMKGQPGKDMWLLGSPTLARSMMKLGLIDEYLININPVVLGAGQSLFANLDVELSLNLLSSRVLKGGVVTTHYST
ncbi:MAG: dihydrofolate reductase family protein [Chloroflexota bacterium]